MTELYVTPAQKLTEKYNLTALVETGCYQCAGLNYAKSIGFLESNLYSCDINTEFAKKAKSIMPAATILPTESISFLTQILPDLSKQTLFWLDAHYPLHYGILNETPIEKMPLSNEIMLIKHLKKNYCNDVIICDDIRVIADIRNPIYKPGEISEYYYVSGIWDELNSILSDTHDLSIDSVGEGIAVFTPKETNV